MTCWTTIFFLRPLCSLEWEGEEAMKTLNQKFSFLRIFLCRTIRTIFPYIISRAMRWRRIFYHAPSTRINSKHDSVVDWGLHGGELVEYYEHKIGTILLSSSCLACRREEEENPTHLILSTYLNRKLNFYGCDERNERKRETKSSRRTYTQCSAAL